jgi:CHRD domain
MKKLLVLPAVAAVALAAATLSAAAPAATWSVTATLNAGQEIPKQVVKNQVAHGAFTATLTGRKLKWKLTFAKLTGPALAAHIHMGAMGASGNVIVPLCQPCKSGQTGTSTLTAAQIAAMKKHLTYVNVHTTKNPNGEIRGQVVARTM